jgi:ribose-phosphate pyrophosphokinase
MPQSTQPATGNGSARAPLQILACAPAESLAKRVASRMNLSLVPAKETWFACGEGKFEIGANVRGSDLYIFQNVIAQGDARSTYDRFVMLLHAVEAASLADAQYVTAVVPYFPGARQDKRKDRVREGISAGLFARCLQDAGAKRVIALEIHNEAIGGMFNPAQCRLENLYLYGSIAPWLKRRGLAGDVVASPDVGGAERARHYAETLSSRLAVLSKVRDYSTANRVVNSTLIGEVNGSDVLLVDDIVDTAGSVVAAVEELKSHGAKDITVACAHPVMSAPAWERLGKLSVRAAAEGWKFNVVGTSSIEHPDAPAYYHSFDVAELLSRVIRGVNTRGSVTGAQHDG